MAKPKAVLFDLFETLVSEVDIADVPSSAEIVARLRLNESTFLRRYADSRADRFSGRVTWRDVLQECVQCCDSPVGSAAVLELAARRERAFTVHLSTVPEKILDLVDRFRLLGLATGLVSNTDGSEVASWRTSMLGPRMDAAIFSHEVGHPKPHPAMYEAACRALSVSPGECVFIGDGNADELGAAASAGMKTICAAWFLKEHTSVLGHDIVHARAKQHPIAWEPADAEVAVGAWMHNQELAG